MDDQVMRVAIDISKLHKLSRQRGIGNYTQNLIAELQKNKHVELQIIENVTDKKNCEVVHYPFFDLFRPSLPLLKYAPTIVTIHDVIPLLFPEHYPPGIKGKLALAKQKLALKNVKAVITDSQSSKRDIIKYLGVPENKIFPIYLAPSPHFKEITDHRVLEETKSEFNLPESFVLYAGSVNWNKNLLNLARAAIKSGIDLVCVGGGFESKSNPGHPELKSFKKFMEDFGDNSRVHILGYVENSKLVSLINLATVVLQVSYYEGFGLPVLEAQACKTAVICSNNSSLPEVAGEGAVLVNPESVEEISEAIIRLINDKNYRQSLISRGNSNLARFSWEKTAQETLEVYRYAKNS